MALEIFKLVGSILVDNTAANNSIHDTDSKAQGLGGTFMNMIDQAGKWAVGLSTAALTVATAIGVDAVGAASNFETSFAKVNTLLSDTTDIEAYKQAILDLSNETGVATSDLSEAIYSAISAGVDEANAIDFVSQALKLSEGGFTDAATAVDVMTTAINAYGLSAEDATRVSDYLITTQNLGKTTVDELASSIGKVIPIASAYGVQMDDLSANMALLTKNGIATAEATTYTKNMLNELGDSGSTVSRILQEEMGMSFAELEENGYSLGDVIEILGESVDGDATAFNELWSSSEAGIGALTLLNAGSQEYNNTLAQMQSSAGATESAYNTMHSTFSTSLEAIKNNIENMKVGLGEALLPVVQNVFDTIVAHMPEIQEMVMAMAPTIQDLFEKLLPPLLQLINTVLPLVIGLINELVPIITTVLSEVMPPLIEIVEAFIAVMGEDLAICIEAVSIYINDTLIPAFQGAWDKVIAVKDGILGAWTAIKDGISSTIQSIATFVSNGFRTIVDGIKSKINSVIGFFNGLIDGLNRISIEVPGWLQDYTGITSFGFNIPHIPELARGGLIEDAGTAIVGEAGAELIDLPAGAKVTPLQRSGGEGGSVEQKIETMIELLEQLVSTMPEAVAEGVSQLEFNFDGREVGRMIRSYE